MRQESGKLRIAYAIQNVGGIDFSKDIGDTVPVKQTLRGLRLNGHQITCFRLSGRDVIGFRDVSRYKDSFHGELGLSGKKTFKFLESVVRRTQSRLKLPYLALFDSYRYFEGAVRFLPEYDLCHEHNGLLSVGAALACRRLNKPYVLTFSADPIFEFNLYSRHLSSAQNAVASWEARLTYRLADRIICVSAQAKEQLVESWGVEQEKIVVLPNGVDIDLFQKEYDPKRIQQEFGMNDYPIVGFVGGFQKWHGLDQLAESFKLVLNDVPQARLLLVGDGRARQMIDRKLSELNLSSVTTITGIVPQKRVSQILSAVDVAVLPYPKLPKELWFSPLKLYEYMASGKAIVASDAGQIAEVIQDGQNGLLVEAGNIPSLAKSIVYLLQSKAERKRIGENARQQAVERHSWDRYIQKLEDIYSTILQERQDD